jgi:hypothetical protein
VRLRKYIRDKPKNERTDRTLAVQLAGALQNEPKSLRPIPPEWIGRMRPKSWLVVGDPEDYCKLEGPHRSPCGCTNGDSTGCDSQARQGVTKECQMIPDSLRCGPLRFAHPTVNMGLWFYGNQEVGHEDDD